jgi:hypothetical protein
MGMMSHNEERHHFSSISLGIISGGKNEVMLDRKYNSDKEDKCTGIWV